jgi:hypothetical protein
MLLSMVFTGYAQCGRASRFNNTDQTGINQEVPIAQVGDLTLTDRLVTGELQNVERMYGQVDQLPAELQLQLQSSTINSVVGNALLLQLAKKYGIEPSNDDIKAMLDKGIEDELSKYRAQLVQEKKLSPTATAAEFAEAFKKVSGKSLDEVKKALADVNQPRIENADLRIPLAAMAVQTPLLEAVKKTITLSDEDLKKSYDSFVFKKISIVKGDAEALAKKALGEIKGGLSFETAIDRYSNDTPEKGKKLSETTSTIGRQTIEGFEPYKPLANLKPGEVSDIVKTGSTVSIYKLLSVKSELPKDFEKNKATYRDSVSTGKASAKLQGELAEMQKSAQITWKSDAYRLVYEFGRLSQQAPTPAEKKKKLQSLMADAEKTSAAGDNPFTARLARLVQYVAFNQLYQDATPEEKSKLDDQKVTVLRSYLEDHEDANLRLELVDLFKKKKDAAEFFNELLNAANANSGALDAQGQSFFSRINKFLKEGEDEKLLTAEQAKQIQDIQRNWVQMKSDQDKIEAENKAAEDKARKEAEAADKAAKAKEVKTRDELNKEKAGSGPKK